MQEPAYIMKNGKNVPYIPIEVKTAREAYAASLHVLFKHVADFHMCVVKTFSAKYGIPEDDILKTIQESEEFKNMHVDPVLDTDSETLGYLTSAPKKYPEVQPKEPEVQPKEPEVQSKEPEVQQPVVSVKKRIVKKKTVDLAQVSPPETTQEQPILIPIQAPITVTVPVEKKRVIKKKPIEPLRTDTDIPITNPATIPATIPPILTNAPITLHASPTSDTGADVAKLLAISDTTGSHIQKKIIKKKK